MEVSDLLVYIDVLNLSSTPVFLSNDSPITVNEPSRPPRRKLVDVPFVIRHRLEELGLEQQDLARAVFEQQPFGELARLVTQTLLDVVKRVAKNELENDYWLRMVAQLSGRSYEEMRVVVLEFLDTDIFHVSAENCVSFLDPLIESWDIDLATFGLEIVLNHSVVPGQAKRFEFVEREADQPVGEEPGLQEFLQDSSLSGTATPKEIAFLKRLKFQGQRPTR